MIVLIKNISTREQTKIGHSSTDSASTAIENEPLN